MMLGFAAMHDGVDGGPFVVATDESGVNRLFEYRGETWVSAATWSGRTINAVVGFPDCVVVAESNTLRIVSAHVSTSVETACADIYALSQAGQGRAVFGGRLGRFGYLTIENAAEGLVQMTLASCGISKPGRDIIDIHSYQSRTVLAGASGLLVERGTDGTCRSLLFADQSSVRYLIRSIVHARGEIIVAGRGDSVVVGSVRDGAVVPFSVPSSKYGPGRLVVVDGVLYVLQDVLASGWGDSWEVHLHAPAGEIFIGLCRLGSGELIAVTSGGRCFRRGKQWIEGPPIDLQVHWSKDQ